jgi:hypothetical protein
VVSDDVAVDSPAEAALRRIADASAALDGVSDLELPVAAERFNELHSELQGALSDLDNS